MQYSLKFALLHVCLLSTYGLLCQNITLQGNVTKSDSTPLPNANLLAFPELEGENTRFSISDKHGEFKLRLAKNVEYKIIISYLGYKKLTYSFKAEKDTYRSFLMEAFTETLDEVVVSYKIPITVKKDTIIYDVDAFRSGKEIKLAELLKKLPGIEVDRDGNVTAQGKKITSVLVENKKFFTGDSKLAVKNIPADAVDEIEILDNYNEISFLKGLQDSDEMAMNIRLKEDKKKFAFGDLEVGAGYEKRYSAHSNIFYYSPKTNINFIGDASNTGNKSFTMRDYIEFEGGFSKLINNSKSYYNLFSDDFNKFLENKDLTVNQNLFGAFNFRQSISRKTDLNTYLITNSSNSQAASIVENKYTGGVNSISEKRNTTNIVDEFFTIGKITLEYDPSSLENLSLNTFFKFSDNMEDQNIVSAVDEQSNLYVTKNASTSFNIKQNVAYSKKFSKSHTLSADATASYREGEPKDSWESSRPFLTNRIPFVNDSIYSVLQEAEANSFRVDLIGKDYWVLNNFNHLYTTLGVNLLFDNFISSTQQELSDGSLNNLSHEGFGNNTEYFLSDLFLGLEYKFLIGKIVFKPAAYYHNYSWMNKQEGGKISNTTSLILPELAIKAELNNSEKISFRYKVNTRFPNGSKLIMKSLISAFNQVYNGDSNLTFERFHSIVLNYYKFRLLRGYNLSASIIYNKRTQSFKSITELNGIEQTKAITPFVLPENTISTRLNLNKRFGNIKFSIKGFGSYNDFFQIVNSVTTKNISKTMLITGGLETFFEKLPNVEIGYTAETTNFETNLLTSNFNNNEFFANLNYTFLNNLRFKFDYSRFHYTNLNSVSQNIYDIANTSLFYNKEDSRWSFELISSNLFNAQFKRQNSFSDFLISDRQNFIIPRILMLKISYKL